MKIFGLQIDRTGISLGGLHIGSTAVSKAAAEVTVVPAAAVGNGGGWWGVIRESFAGAWQRNIEIDPTQGLLAFSAVYACIDLISRDISKLRPKLMALDPSGVWIETTNPAFSPVLRKPNWYQTRIQFLSQWIASKLIYGNAYVLKQRDGRGAVVEMHVLNPRMVKAVVTERGDVYYQLSHDRLAGIESMIVPAREIIHDRAICLFHPLIGVPPIFACGMSASQGNRIQNNSAKFFENMSRPSGQLTSPNTITDETAERLKRDFESKFSGSNLGRLLVAGDGLKYETLGTIPAQQAQLIEQLEWTVADVARCFHVPLHKIASDTGVKYANMAEMNQDYYSQCLQGLIEDIEILLDEGLGLADGGPQALGVELDLEVLLRMDPVQRATRNAALMKAGAMSPDEARAPEGLLPVAGGGGKQPFMQAQNYPLSQLIKQVPPGAESAAAAEAKFMEAANACVSAARALDRASARSSSKGDTR